MRNVKSPGEPNINRLIGRRVRQLRVKKDLTQQALADRMDVTYQQIQKYEYGLHILSPAKLVALARILGVHVGYFFREPDVREKYTPPDAGLLHLMDRLEIIERERPEALAAVQDIVRVLCNEIQGVRPVPRPHRRKRKA